MSREWSLLSQHIKDAVRAHQENAPVKLSVLAKALGVGLKAATLPAGISGEIRPDPNNPGNVVIRVNRHDSDKRQRFTVAHEIAHFLLHRDHIGNGIKDDVLYRSSLSDRREAEANRLAADLLMPEHLIAEWLERARLLRVEDVVGYLAEQFEVSEASMRIRLGLA
jgi:Zn-dependent peptidase ImmA (M78 family)